MKGKKISTLNVLLVLIILAASVTIGLLMVKLKSLESSLFSLAYGESFPDLELYSVDSTKKVLSKYSKGVLVVFCFQIPCSECNSNIGGWTSIAQFFGEKIYIIGIVPDGNAAAFQLEEEKRVNFPICIPGEPKTFARKFRLKSNIAQTIVFFDNKVKMVKIGELTREDLNELISEIKNMLKTS